MYPLLRLIRVVVKSNFQEKLSFVTEYTDSVNLIVLPQDIDPFMELNNGRYVTLLDLGRFSLGAKVNMASFLKRNNWSLTIVGTYNEYRFRLRLFQRFTLKTKIIGYDEKWFYFFHEKESTWDIDFRASIKILQLFSLAILVISFTGFIVPKVFET